MPLWHKCHQVAAIFTPPSLSLIISRVGPQSIVIGYARDCPFCVTPRTKSVSRNVREADSADSVLICLIAGNGLGITVCGLNTSVDFSVVKSACWVETSVLTELTYCRLAKARMTIPQKSKMTASNFILDSSSVKLSSRWKLEPGDWRLVIVQNRTFDRAWPFVNWIKLVQFKRCWSTAFRFESARGR